MKFTVNTDFSFAFSSSPNCVPELSEQFAALINSILPYIAAVHASPDELRSILQRAYFEMMPQLKNAETMDQAFEIIIESCSLLNLDCLEVIIHHYNIDRAKKMISDYNAKIADFRQKELIHFLGKSFRLTSSHLLICDTVQFTLEGEPAEYLLEDIQSLVESFFGDFSRKVHIDSIQYISSLINVVCYASQHFGNILQIEMQKNLDNAVIVKKKMIKLCIGHFTVFHKNEHIEVEICIIIIKL